MNSCMDKKNRGKFARKLTERRWRRGVFLSLLYGATALECAAEGHLIGVFQFAAHRNPTRQTTDLQGQRVQGSKAPGEDGGSEFDAVLAVVHSRKPPCSRTIVMWPCYGKTLVDARPMLDHLLTVLHTLCCPRLSTPANNVAAPPRRNLAPPRLRAGGPRE